MAEMPESVARFLAGKRLAVAGVSRKGDTAASAVFRKLRDCGYEVFPVNPSAGEVEGVTCYPDLASIPDPVDGVVIATHPSVSASVVRQCEASGVRQVWFHRSFGAGSVSREALDECQRLGIEPIASGCPLMYCEPVDAGHRCIRWWLRLWRRVPG